MYRLKRAAASLWAVLLLFVFSFSASAVVVDGYVGNAEWLDSPRELLFLSEKDSGNALNMGIVFLVTEFQNNRLHLAVKAGGKNCTHGSLAGVRFVLGSYGTVHLDFREPKNPAYDGEKLHAVGAMADASEIDIPNEFSAELSLLLKTPAPERMVLTLWLMDSQGEPSLPFAFTLVNPYAVVSTTTAPTMTSAYNTTTTRSTTTRTTTTRTTTTRESTTARTTTTKATTTRTSTQPPQSTTAPPTTTQPTTTTTTTLRYVQPPFFSATTAQTLFPPPFFAPTTTSFYTNPSPTQSSDSITAPASDSAHQNPNVNADINTPNVNNDPNPPNSNPAAPNTAAPPEVNYAPAVPAAPPVFGVPPDAVDTDTHDENGAETGYEYLPPPPEDYGEDYSEIIQPPPPRKNITRTIAFAAAFSLLLAAGLVAVFRRREVDS